MSGPSRPCAMHPHTIKLCLPDLNVGVRHFCECFSPGLLHTTTCLDCFPISTELSSVQMTLFHNSISHPLCVRAHASRSRLWESLRKGFLAATRECMSKCLCKARRIVRGWAGVGKAQFMDVVMLERVCRRFASTVYLRRLMPLSSSLGGLPDLAASLWCPLFW